MGDVNQFLTILLAANGVLEMAMLAAIISQTGAIGNLQGLVTGLTSRIETLERTINA